VQVENQSILLQVLHEKQVRLSIKREDLIHPLISGNKYRKLKYNLEAAKTEGFKSLLTFGGAFSNHIAATAYAGKMHGFKTIGVIRGEEISQKWQSNPTLKLASEHGMQLKFINREAYRDKDSEELTNTLKSEYGTFYVIPEGGSNTLAVKGCEEILTPEDMKFDTICTSVGTGGTIAGIVNSSAPNQSVLGFTALKSDYVKEDIRKFAAKKNWQLLTDYHFGGYAKVTSELVQFINDFKLQTQILLDPVYTGKMIYGIIDLVKNDYFKPKTSILAIHTGGLQGISGMNIELKKRNLPPIL